MLKVCVELVFCRVILVSCFEGVLLYEGYRVGSLAAREEYSGEKLLFFGVRGPKGRQEFSYSTKSYVSKPSTYHPLPEKINLVRYNYDGPVLMYSECGKGNLDSVYYTYDYKEGFCRLAELGPVVKDRVVLCLGANGHIYRFTYSSDDRVCIDRWNQSNKCFEKTNVQGGKCTIVYSPCSQLSLSHLSMDRFNPNLIFAYQTLINGVPSYESCSAELRHGEALQLIEEEFNAQAVS